MVNMKLIVLFLTVCVLKAHSSNDEFLNESQKICKQTHKTYACIKYRAARFISFASDGLLHKRQFGPLKIITIENYKNDTGALFGDARQLENDDELSKIFKFLKRQAEKYIMNHALEVPLTEDGIQVIERTYEENESNNEIDKISNSIESRGKKKKLSVLLPFLIILKLAKVKLLLIAVLVGVIFLKKSLMVAALLAPSVFNMLKVCKIPSSHSHGHEHTEVEVGDYGSYSGGYSSYSASPYGKEWSPHDRVYNAHKPL